MKQLNLNVTSEFERDLRTYMKSRGIGSKSEAIRRAVREAASRNSGEGEYDLRALLGIGLKAPLNQKRRFLTEDDLWS
jgi:Arc/MetJ-type ribon-helix-helix transcriptional regulator